MMKIIRRIAAKGKLKGTDVNIKIAINAKKVRAGNKKKGNVKLCKGINLY